jgi:UDP-N-acetylmuramate-alanine ligase
MQVEDCEDFQIFAIFQADINCLLHECHQEWTSTLSHVDGVVVYTRFQSGNGIHSIANAKVVV